MNFCPACGALLLFEEAFQNVRLVCKICNYDMSIDKQLLSEVPLKAKKKDDVLVKDWSKEAQISSRCPKCSNNKAYYYQLQIRSADEPMTTFYKCTKVDCGHQWNDD